MQAKNDKFNQAIKEVRLVLSTLTSQGIITPNVEGSINARLSDIGKNSIVFDDLIEHVMKEGNRHINYGSMSSAAPIESKAIRRGHYTIMVIPDEQKYNKIIG